MDDPQEDESLEFKPQKQRIYNKHLPYYKQLPSEALLHLKKIKENISRSVLLSEPRSLVWIHELKVYLNLYGYYFPKEDHVFFIKILLEIVVFPDLPLSAVQHHVDVLNLLLKKQELLSPEDLTIQWRPLYDLYYRVHFSSKDKYGFHVIPDNFDNTLQTLFHSARTYFPLEATQEILDECRPRLCSDSNYNNGISRATHMLCLCLPTLLRSEYHHLGYKLWFDELLTLWEANEHSPVWEPNLIALFARLARDNIGYINWDPWIPKVFTLLLRSFGLMEKGLRREQFDVNAAALWIISMIGGPSSMCLDHIGKLFKSLESYYHPSNVGKWNAKLSILLCKLPLQMVKRVHNERHKKKSWIPAVPEAYRIKDSEITEFVNILKPITLISMFSRIGGGNAAYAFQNLSALRPEMVIPPLIQKLYSALETVTEPHRLTATMQCAILVARNMVASRNHYPEGATHVIPLLFLTLPGIDSNDMQKCLVAFQFISILIKLVPVVDCSPLVDNRNDLSETEYITCLATSQWEDFVLQFVDRCIALVENSSFENPSERQDNDNVRLNMEENIIELGLTSTFQSILSQTSPEIFESALDKLHSYVACRIFEAKVAGKMIANMCRAFVKVDPEKSLAKFLPHYSKLIFALTETEENLREEHLDEQLLFSLLVISESVRCNGAALLKYKQLLLKVLRRSLQLTKRTGYTSAGLILRNTLKSLTNVYCIDYRSFPEPLDEFCDLSKSMPLRSWGAPGDIKNLNVRWHVPNEEEIEFASQLVNEFLSSELGRLADWSKGEIQLTREELIKSLTVVQNIVNGAAASLPVWEAEAVSVGQNAVSLCRTRRLQIGSPPISFNSSANVREVVAKCMRNVLQHILSEREDDTKALNILIQILNGVLFFWGISKREIDQHWKGFHVAKEALENKVVGAKKHDRWLLLDRVALQHECRVYHASLTKLTELHCDLLKDLMSLSTSHYSAVRSKAQEVVSTFVRHYPYSYTLIVPTILKILDEGSSSTHEELKGALYVLQGKGKQSLLTIKDWVTKKDLWLALVASRYSEKESIINMLAKMTETVNKRNETLGIEFTATVSSKEVAKLAWTTGVACPSDMPSIQDIEQSEELCRLTNIQNLKAYEDLVRGLSKHITGGNLHWRYNQLAFAFLCRIVTLKIKFPVDGVQVVVNNLISESIAIRKMSISSLAYILEQQKRPHPKMKFSPEANGMSGNSWLQYRPDVDYRNEKVWRSTVFIEKAFHGFYCWPKNGVDVYLEEEKQPNLNRKLEDLSDEEKPIFQFFMDKNCVEKLFSLLSLEERKGHDKFNSRRFSLFKGLYRNYGQIINIHIKEKLETFTGHPHESFQRCAAETIAGLVRGCKHWPYQDVMELKNFLVPLLKVMLTKMTPETVVDWGTCCATSFGSRDSRKLSWFAEIFLEDPLNIDQTTATDISPSFLQSSRLYCLLGVVGNMQWRGLAVLHKLLNYLVNHDHLSHSYENVRERLGTLLSNIFLYDSNVPSLPGTLDSAPRRQYLFKLLLPKLEILASEHKNDMTEKHQPANGVVDVPPERKTAMNILKTLCHWITSNLPKAPFTAHEFYDLLPTLCEMQSEVKDDALRHQTLVVIVVLSHAQMSLETASHAIYVCEKVIESKSWHARSAVSTFLQHMVFSNLFTIMNNQNLSKKITSLILKLLNDERIEVRESGASTLGGLIHCEFIQVSEKFIKTLKEKCDGQIRKSQNLTNFSTTYNMSDLMTRHAGVLGLGAIVNAYPYDVPDFLPDVLMILAGHLHDPQPVAATVKKIFSDFRRTHYDNWRDHKLKFSEDQLAVITDLLISPSYYA